MLQGPDSRQRGCFWPNSSRGLSRRDRRKGDPDDFHLALHPDWITRYGALARRRGVEDAIFHQDFLTAAIETGEPDVFGGYLRWTTGVLAARGIASHFLHENVEQISREFAVRLSPALALEVQEFVAAALDAALVNETAAPAEAGALDSERELYLQAILHGQRQAAVGIAVEAARQGHPLPDVYADILRDSMYEVGRRWQTNRISVAQEHWPLQ